MVTNVRDNDGKAPEALLFMPAGTHTICAHVNGEPQERKVEVNAAAAEVLQHDLQQRLDEFKAGKAARPCGYFDHAEGKASFLPKRFSWQEGKGVVLEVEWTGSGKKAVEERDYSYFSPRFTLNKDGQVAGLVPTGVEIGSLVNNPAFDKIEMIAASKPAQGGQPFAPAPARDVDKDGEAGDNDGMDEIKKKLGLPPDASEADILAALDKLKGCKEDAEKNAATAEAAKKEADECAEKAHKEAEDAKKEVTAMKAQLEAADKDAEEAFISAACAAGKLAPKDEATQNAWRAMFKADRVSARKAMDGMPVNAALSNVTAGKTPLNNGDGKTAADIYTEEMNNL